MNFNMWNAVRLIDVSNTEPNYTGNNTPLYGMVYSLHKDLLSLTQ